jgi:hypothetical protein
MAPQPFFQDACTDYHLPSMCVTKRRHGGKREKSKEETKRHTQGADPATQADTVHSRGGKSRAGAYTNRNGETQQPHAADTRTNQAPQAARTDTKCGPPPAARPRNKQEKRKGAMRRHATEAPGKPGARVRQAPAARGHTAHQ